MGSLRTLLALAVVMTHSYGFLLTGGQLSVQLFYVISGFLISYVLSENPAYARPRLFYLNRFLRIFPVYWVVALATFALYLAAYAAGMTDIGFWRTFGELGWGARAALILSNIAIFGQDWLMFTGVSRGSFGFAADFQQSEVAVWQGLLIGPAWTLGLELTFYLLAPFIIRHRGRLWTLLALSLAIKACLFGLGVGWKDPWSYRFFPAELCFFLIGAVSQQYLLPKVDALPSGTRDRAAMTVTATMVGACLIFAWLPMREAAHLAMIALGAVAMPFLFRFQARFDWDAKIGELSYPIYIVHMLVVFATLFVLGKAGMADQRIVVALFAVPATVVAAMLLNRFVAEPVEAMRRRVKAKAATPSA